MDPAAAAGLVRVAIISDDAVADLALPTGIAIRELIPRIRLTLATGRDDAEGAEDKDAQAAAVRPYSLAPLGGTPLSLDATLDTVGVADGEQLMLCALPPGPAAPPVIEDLADAAAIHSAQRFRSFEHGMLTAAAQAAFLAVGAFVVAAAIYGWSQGYLWWARSALAGVAVVFVLATIRLHRRDTLVEAGTRAGVATIVPLAAALAAALPGTTVAPRIFLAGCGAIAWSLLVSVITNRAVAIHIASVVVAGATAGAAAARIAWHLPNLALGCGLLAVSLLLAANAPTAAARWARFPLPNVPAPGEPIPPAPTRAELEDLPRRAALTHSCQTGFIAASVILAAGGSALVVWLPDRPSLLCWWLVAATAAVTVMRMRIWNSAAPALWFAVSPLLLAATLAVTFTAADHLVAGLWATAALIVLMAITVAAAAVKPGTLPIPRRRWLDLTENALLYTIPPAILWLIGVISLIRNRGAI